MFTISPYLCTRKQAIENHLLFNPPKPVTRMEERFFFCDTCGNLLIAALASGVTPDCCGHEMTPLDPNTHDGIHEKHMPVVTFISRHSLKVNIGSTPHPMTMGHNIQVVCLETTSGFVVRYLKPESLPEVCIRFNGKPIAVYAYCNIHGLWRAEVPPHDPECNDNMCVMHE